VSTSDSTAMEQTYALWTSPLILLYLLQSFIQSCYFLCQMPACEIYIGMSVHIQYLCEK